MLFVLALYVSLYCMQRCWAEAPVKIARMTLTIKLDGNWSSFQLANNTPPLSVTGSVIAPSARICTRIGFSGVLVLKVWAYMFLCSGVAAQWRH